MITTATSPAATALAALASLGLEPGWNTDSRVLDALTAALLPGLTTEDRATHWQNIQTAHDRLTGLGVGTTDPADVVPFAERGCPNSEEIAIAILRSDLNAAVANAINAINAGNN